MISYQLPVDGDFYLDNAATTASATQVRRAQVDAARLNQAVETGDLDKIHTLQAELTQSWTTTPGDSRHSRRVDLTPYLDGSYIPPQPDRGAHRDDGKRLLYPGRWHTVIGPNESGKTWLGLGHARDEMHAGRYVVWIHFEEPDPGGTIARLLAIGVTPDVIAKQFVWLSCDRAWTEGELAAELARLPSLGLLALDGINAACTRHSHDPEKTLAVGWYRHVLATPATRLGWTVLSLGHPVKAKDRQNERHGYGSTAWLDEVDGVGFRLTANPTAPIRRGRKGAASLYAVKDRYGEVQLLGTPQTGDRAEWTYVGSLVVDDSHPAGGTQLRITAPESATAAGPADDEIDRLADAIPPVLATQPGQRYASQRDLIDKLRAAKITYNDRDLGPALERLAAAGRIHRDPTTRGKPRGGRLSAVQDPPQLDLDDPG